MFGPRTEIQGWDYSLVLREITDDALADAALPDEEVFDYTPLSNRMDLNDLVIYKEESGFYDWVENRNDIIAWGVHVVEGGRERWAGFTGLFPMLDEPAAPGWKEAEVAAMLYYVKDMGRGMATRFYPYVMRHALQEGFDSIRGAVQVGNERSRRSLERVNFVLLGETDVPDAPRQYDLRWYNPALGEVAVEHALELAQHYGTVDLATDDVRKAQARIAAMPQPYCRPGEAAA